MTNRSARHAGLDEELANLKEVLADGIDKIVSGDDWKNYLKFAARFPRYSFTNMMLVFAQRPDATLVMPYGERKDGNHTGWYAAGRTLVPGAQKIWIWKPYSRKAEVEGKGGEKETRSYVNFYQVPVYDVADTEGEPLPENDTVRLLEGDDAKGLLKLVLEFITDYGFAYEFVPSIPGSPANGDMNPTGKRIRICTDGRSEKQQAKTALHEAAHMLLHSAGKEVSVPREQKEVEAESVAFIVSAYLGVDTGDYSFGYVAGWAAETGYSHRTAIKHSGKRISLAASQLINAVAPWDDAEAGAA